MSWQLLPAADFKAQASQWDSLLERMGGSPLLHSDFVLPMLVQWGTGREQLAVLKTGLRCSAMALVAPAGRGFWRALQPAGMPLCAWLCPGADVASAAHQLLSELPGWNVGLHLGSLDPRMHVRSHAEPFEYTAKVAPFGLVEVAPGREGSNSRRLRESSKVTRKREKLASEGIRTHLEYSVDAEAVVPALRQFEALRRRGRHSHTAGHRPLNTATLTQTMVAFSAKGQGRIYSFYFGDRLVAMDLCISHGGEVVVLATAYDESFRSASPFTLMRHDELKAWSGDESVRSLALYGQVLGWHRNWRHDANWLYSRTLYRWPLLRSVHAPWGIKHLNSASGAASPSPRPQPSLKSSSAEPA